MSTRREFIKQVAVASAALAIGDKLDAMGKKIPVTAPGRVLGANDKVRVAVAGVHNRGRALAMNFAQMTSDCEVVYICDCDSAIVPAAQEACKAASGIEPKYVRDYRELVKMPDIDVIVVAMPDHWHAAAAIMAMENGKHVYLEKPATHTPAENEMVLKAQKKYGKVVQIGTQRRSWPTVREGIEILRNGEYGLGTVSVAKSWYSHPRPSIGKFDPSPVPENLDWELWQGPAPHKKEFKANCLHYNWHWYWDWGTGEALNNGSHFIDVIRWGMGLADYPTLVNSVGGKYRFVDDDWQTPDYQLITLQYGDRCSVNWEGRSRNHFPTDGLTHGVTFYGEDSCMWFDFRDSYVIRDMKGNVIKEAVGSLPVRVNDTFNPCEALDTIHLKNFLDGIRLGTPLNAPLIEGCKSTQLMQYGNIAQRVGHSLHIDPKTGKILGDNEAMKYWTRKYEKGWMPKV